MIEIVIHNGGRLDLPEDFELSIIHENPLFLEDRIPAPYSVQFDVPPTANNLQIFGMPNRIASSGLKKNLPADLIHYGYIMSRGQLILTGCDDTPKLQFVGSIQLELMGKNLNDLDLGDFDYGSFPAVGEDIDYADSWAANYVAAMELAATGGNPYAVAPMKIKGAVWEGDDNLNGTKNALSQYINYYNPIFYNFLAGDNSRAHTPILPMPYLKDIIEVVFGDKLETNPFATGDFAKLVLPTFNHKYYSYSNLLGKYVHLSIPHLFFNPLVDDYGSAGSGARDLAFSMKSFQQAYPFSSLLKNILKIFSMTMFSGRVFSIEHNDEIFNRTIVKNWDERIAGTPVKSYKVAKDYLFSYGETSNVISTNVTKFANMKALFDDVIAGDENTDYVCQDESTGGIYKMNVISVPHGLLNQKIVRSDIQQSPLSVYYSETDREKYEVNSDLKPIDLNIHPCWGEEDPRLKFHWLVPEIEIKEIKQPPYIMFKGGITPVLGGQDYDPIVGWGNYPSLLAHNYDAWGYKLFDFSLLPSGPDGLITKFHSKFKAWVEKDKLQLKVSVRLTPAEVRALDFRDKYHVGGRLFYIEKLEYQLSHNSLSLVEADLIEC
jgi:hypothetical protein